MICPNCQKDVKVTEQNIGTLFTCPSCQAAYFINFEGQPEFSNDNEIPTAPEPVAPILKQSKQAPVQQASQQFSALPPQNESTNTQSAEPGFHDYGGQNNDQLNQFGQNDFSENQSNDFSSPETNNFAAQIDYSAPTNEFANTPVNDFSTPANEFSAPADTFPQAHEVLPPQNDFGINQSGYNQVPANASFASIAKDISDFGNTDTQIAGLNYDLRISGLDTAEIIALFKEAIEDRRFGWETNELMRSIKNGEVLLEKLNPAKAYILSKRLQFVDVEKSWKQNVLN